jgi:hypothetical protein
MNCATASTARTCQRRHPDAACGPNADGINDRLALIVFRAGVEVEAR